MSKILIAGMIMFSVCILLILGSNYQSVIAHENAHKQIMEYDGCNNVTIETYFNFNSVGGYAECQDPNYVQSSEAFIVNGNNEVLGYQMSIFIQTFYLGIFALIYMIMVLYWRD